jgi:hypothetical protein
MKIVMALDAIGTRSGTVDPKFADVKPPTIVDCGVVEA